MEDSKCFSFDGMKDSECY